MTKTWCHTNQTVSFGLADTASLSWRYRELFQPVGVFFFCINCGSHFSTSITVMIAEAFGSDFLPPALPWSCPCWHYLQDYDVASLTVATKVVEGAFKKCVCVHDYAGNKGLRVTGFNNGKCEAWLRWETGLLSTIAAIRLCPHAHRTHPWVAAGTIRQAYSYSKKAITHLEPEK